MRPVLRLVDLILTCVCYPFVHPKARLATVAAVALVVGWAFGWTGSAMRSATDNVGRPLHERAAFTWEENFEGGFRNWTNPTALAAADDNAVRVKGLALHGKTQGMKTYEMKFQALADKRSIAWVVRATDSRNYYVFKLNPRKSVTAHKRDFDLVRYAVLEGKAPASSAREIAPTVVRVPEHDFFEVTARVTEDEVYTLVNGYVLDTWKNPMLKTGALGFLAEDGDSFLIKSLVISGHEDFLGLFLWGAEETLRKVQRGLTSLGIRRADNSAV